MFNFVETQLTSGGDPRDIAQNDSDNIVYIIITKKDFERRESSRGYQAEARIWKVIHEWAADHFDEIEYILRKTKNIAGYIYEIVQIRHESRQSPGQVHTKKTEETFIHTNFVANEPQGDLEAILEIHGKAYVKVVEIAGQPYLLPDRYYAFELNNGTQSSLLTKNELLGVIPTDSHRSELILRSEHQGDAIIIRSVSAIRNTRTPPGGGTKFSGVLFVQVFDDHFYLISKKSIRIIQHRGLNERCVFHAKHRFNKGIILRILISRTSQSTPYSPAIDCIALISRGESLELARLTFLRRPRDIPRGCTNTKTTYEPIITLDPDAEGRPRGLTEGRLQGLTEDRPRGNTEGRPRGNTEGRLRGLTGGRPRGLTEETIEEFRKSIFENYTFATTTRNGWGFQFYLHSLDPNEGRLKTLKVSFGEISLRKPWKNLPRSQLEYLWLVRKAVESFLGSGRASLVRDITEYILSLALAEITRVINWSQF